MNLVEEFGNTYCSHFFRKDEVDSTQVNGINLMIDAGMGISYDREINQNSSCKGMKVNMRGEATITINSKGKR